MLGRTDQRLPALNLFTKGSRFFFFASSSVSVIKIAGDFLPQNCGLPAYDVELIALLIQNFIELRSCEMRQFKFFKSRKLFFLLIDLRLVSFKPFAELSALKFKFAELCRRNNGR